MSFSAKSKPEQLIAENLDIWTAAIQNKASTGRGSGKKQELYGIKKLRELILELAVRGLLVPQDPNDEPASILLEKVAAEKQLLISEGRLKKPKRLPSINENEKPYELPSGWEFERFGKVYELEYGNNLPQAKRSNSGEYPVYGSNGVVGTHNEYCIDKPCIVVGRKGSAGALNLNESSGCWVTDVAYSVVPPENLFLRYVFLQFHTLGLDSLGKGIKPGLNRNEAYELIVSLPPEAEQLRIVAKVDELMALCDQLEQQTESSLNAHKTLVETLLKALLDAAQSRDDGSSSETAFEQAWQRIADHFDVLFTSEYSIDQLKQTILQLAVMGKLVPQDRNDEPASVLLEKIAAEKERLVKEGKIKKQKKLPPISDDEKPFELPGGWEWCRLGDLAYVFAGNSFKSGDFNETGGTRVIKITNAGVGELVETEDYLPEEFAKEYRGYCVKEGDLILALTRPYISEGLKVSSCPPNYHNALLNQRVAAIRAFSDAAFIYQFMQSHFVLGLYRQRFGGSGLQPNLKMNDVTDLVVPFPAEAEQPRIVAKVSELMAICDSLKGSMRESQGTKLRLADAMAEKALN
jgi:type I restriction enzyme S subunit